MNLRVPKTYKTVQTTLSPIHAYPAFKVEIATAVSPEFLLPLRTACISAHAATNGAKHDEAERQQKQRGDAAPEPQDLAIGDHDDG